MIGVVIAAAGCGARAGLGYNKLLYTVAGRTVIEDTLEAFDGVDCFKVVVARREDRSRIRDLFGDRTDVTIVGGGATRSESVLNGLRACRSLGCDRVLIHDGARPYLSARDLERCLEALDRYGSCVMVRRSADSVRLDGGAIDRDRVRLVSTPQAFFLDEIISAYETAGNQPFTDDASVYEAAYSAPHLEELTDDNEKITTKRDLRIWASRFPQRVGQGFDEHAYADGRKTVLCGVHVPAPYGPHGHSDADAAFHALMNALLTAAGLRDIGVRYPDDDPTYRDADSAALLKDVLRDVKKSGFRPVNVSLVLHAQRPKLRNFIPQMIENVARILDIPSDAVGISATTGEGMGHIGRGEGIACLAICTLTPKID